MTPPDDASARRSCDAYTSITPPEEASAIADTDLSLLILATPPLETDASTRFAVPDMRTTHRRYLR